MLSLANLKTASGAKKAKRRLGRGNASGKGNYSGRGMKGQRARSGGRNKLALKGIRNYLLRIPKSRGFKHQQQKYAIVNLLSLEKLAQGVTEITPKYLYQRGVLANPFQKVKILGQGKLTKKLVIKAHAFSLGAKEAITKAGGKVELISPKS